MKNLIIRNRKLALNRSFYTAVTISVFFYLFVRSLFFEFPMSWIEEIVFFIKIVFTGSVFILACWSGITGIYFLSLRKRSGKKLLRFKFPNALFLRKNKMFVQYPWPRNAESENPCTLVQ